MKPCTSHDGRRGFLKKSASIAALYLTPTSLVKAFAVESVIPTPIAKEKFAITIKDIAYYWLKVNQPPSLENLYL